MGVFERVFRQLVETYSESLFQVVTADSGSCSEANARLVDAHHRAYLLRLEAGDQPTLYEEAHRLLGRMRPEQAEATTVGRLLDGTYAVGGCLERRDMALDTILKTSKALADETRLAIYRHLTTRRGPVGVVDVAESFSLHPNAARAHLAKLEAAGLATSAPERIGGSGRPRRVWRVASAGLAPVFEPAVFKAVAGLLLDLLEEQTSQTAAQVYAFGRRWGRGYASRFTQEGSVETLHADYVLTGLVRTLETWGFSAARRGDLAVTVTRCPLDDLAERHEERICPLIHGVLQGMLEAVRPDLAFDWARGAGDEACEILLSG